MVVLVANRVVEGLGAGVLVVLRLTVLVGRGYPPELRPQGLCGHNVHRLGHPQGASTPPWPRWWPRTCPRGSWHLAIIPSVAAAAIALQLAFPGADRAR